MKITNKRLRREYAQSGYCELCHFYCLKREGHHLRTQTPAIDIRINLISLGAQVLMPDGRTKFSSPCHRLIHAGKISSLIVLNVVALREGTTPAIITEVMDLFRRLVKPTPWELEKGLMELSLSARLLALKELEANPKRKDKPR